MQIVKRLVDQRSVCQTKLAGRTHTGSSAIHFTKRSTEKNHLLSTSHRAEWRVLSINVTPPIIKSSLVIVIEITKAPLIVRLPSSDVAFNEGKLFPRGSSGIQAFKRSSVMLYYSSVTEPWAQLINIRGRPLYIVITVFYPSPANWYLTCQKATLLPFRRNRRSQFLGRLWSVKTPS